MNAYLVDGGTRRYVEEYIDVWARYETSRFVDVVFAKTRGHARKLFIDENDGKWGTCFEWTDPISIRLIARDVEREAGIAADDDKYWWAENWPFPDLLLDEAAS